MSGWTVYLITRLDSINFMLTFIFAMSFIVSVISAVMFLISVSNEDEVGIKAAKSVIKTSIIVCVISMFMCSFIPDMKEAAAIYVIPKITQNEKIQELPYDLHKLFEAKLEEWINDSTKESE